jgi:hypothetical protein
MTQIGTLSGNPVAAARRGWRRSRCCASRGQMQRGLRHRRGALMDGMTAMLRRQPAIAGPGALGDAGRVRRDLSPSRRPPRLSRRGDAATPPGGSAGSTAVLREHGVLKSEGKVMDCTAHSEADVKQTLDGFAAAVDAEKRLRRGAA